MIPAAGRATRLGRLDCSKELLSVGGRPVIDYLVERMRAAAPRALVVVTRPDKRDVADHAEAIGAGVVLGEPSTVAQSLLLGLDAADEQDRVLLGFPDTIWQPADGFARLLERLGDGTDAVLGAFRSREPARSDVVVLEEDRVVALEVKPAQPRSDLVWGCAVAKARTLAGLRRHDEPGLLFAELAGQGRLRAVPFAEEMIDIGTPESLDRARRALGA